MPSAGPGHAAILLDCTREVVVPGYGLAVAHAQHAIRELSEVRCARGIGAALLACASFTVSKR